MNYNVVAVAEDGTPMKGVTVAAVNLQTYPNISQRQLTDKAGSVTFNNLNGPHFFVVEAIRGVHLRERNFPGKIQVQTANIGGNGICYDYVVDKDGSGTHKTVRAMMADFLIAASSAPGVVKCCWLCNSDTDANIEFSSASGNVASSTLYIDGPGGANGAGVRFLTANLVSAGDSYLVQSFGNQPKALILRNVGLGTTGTPASASWLHNNWTSAGTNVTVLTLMDCTLSLGYTLLWTDSPSHGQDVWLYRCTGTGSTVLQTQNGLSSGSVRMFDCVLSLASILPEQYIFNEVEVSGGRLTVSDSVVVETATSGPGNGWYNAFFRNVHIINNGTIAAIQLHQGGSANTHYTSFTDIVYSQANAGAYFLDMDAGAFGGQNIFLDAVYCYNTSGTAPQAISIPASIMGSGTRVMVGDVFSNAGFTQTFNSGSGGLGSPLVAPVTIAGPDSAWNPGLILNDTTPGGTGWMVAHWQRNGTDYAGIGLAGGNSGPFVANDYILDVHKGGTTWADVFGVQNSSGNVGVNSPFFVTNNYAFISNASNFTAPANTTPGDLTATRVFVNNDSTFSLQISSANPLLLVDSAAYYVFDRTGKSHLFYTNSIARLSIGAGFLATNFGRIGSLASPTNVTDGDLTTKRIVLGDDAAITNSARSFLNVNSFVPTPAASTYLSFLSATAAPNNGGAVVVGQQVQVTAAPTVDSVTDDVYGLSGQVQHTLGDFAMRNLYGFQSNAVKNIPGGVKALTNLVSYRAVNRPIAGVVTNMYGIEVVQGATGDAGTLTTTAGVYVHNGVFGSAATQIGLNIEALTGATSNIAIRTLGGTHRLVGPVNIGVDADFNPVYGSRLLQVTDTATLTLPLGFQSSAQVLTTPTVNGLGAISDVLSGFTSGINLTLGANTNAIMRAGFFESILQGGAFTSGEMTGVFGQVTNNDTAVGNALSLGYGVWGNVRAIAGTITKAAALHASLQNQPGDAGSIGTWYGLLIDKPSIVPTVATWGIQLGNGLTVGWLDSGGVARNVMQYSGDDYVNNFVPATAGKKWRVVDQGLTAELLGVDSSGNTNIAGTLGISNTLTVTVTTALDSVVSEQVNWTLNNSSALSGIPQAFNVGVIDAATANRLSLQAFRFTWTRNAGATGIPTAGFDAMAVLTPVVNAGYAAELHGYRAEGPTVAASKTLNKWTAFKATAPGGSGTTTDSSGLEIDAGFQRGINNNGSLWLTQLAAPSANYTVAKDDVTVLGTSSAGGITITLPDATVSKGRMLWIKKVDAGAGALTIATSPNTQTIDGAVTLAMATQYEAVLLTSDGSNWYVISQVATTIL